MMPAVSVVIPTRGRPELVRRAIRSVFDQDLGRPLEVIVVFDQTEIDPFDDIEPPAGHTLRGVRNARSAGLAGARNTGILVAAAEHLAFLDDDDEWYPQKLRLQLKRWEREPEAMIVSCGNVLISQGQRHVRTVAQRMTYGDFVADRHTAVHTSTFLWRTTDLREGPIGLVDENLPHAYGEDYDLLLRATELGPLVSQSEPLAVVHWDRPSFFTGKWQAVAAGLPYLLRKHPSLAEHRINCAHMSGQVAFALAGLGDRRQARRWARASLQRDLGQLRAWAALVASWGILPVERIVALVNRRGRGL